MKRQVIQNFLNLPGLAGVALIDGRNRPFFFGPAIQLNTPQQDALSQGIQQVIETIPAGFDTFSFRFTNQLVHIYKLDQGVILLVLMADQTPLPIYRPALHQLKLTLMEEPHNVVPTFRLLAGCVTLSNGPSATDMPTAAAPGSKPLSSQDSRPAAAATPTAPPTPVGTTYAEVLAALNHLNEGAAQYLGKVIVTNTWKQSRPDQPWLIQFEIQKEGHFAINPLPTDPLTPEQEQWIQDWVSAFLERGSRTFRNFRTLVSGSVLTPSEAKILLGSS